MRGPGSRCTFQERLRIPVTQVQCLLSVILLGVGSAAWDLAYITLLRSVGGFTNSQGWFALSPAGLQLCRPLRVGRVTLGVHQRFRGAAGRPGKGLPGPVTTT